MGLGCGAKLAKLCLIIFNIGFFILGAVALGLGLFVYFDQGNLQALLNMAPDGTIPSNVNVVSLLNAGAIVLIAGGGVIFVFGFLGFCGALKESKILLILYAVMVFLVLAAEIAGGVLAYFYRDLVLTKFNTFLNSTIVNNYVGMGYTSGTLNLDANDAYTLAWDTLHITFECCGLNNYTDFSYSTSWNRQLSLNATTNVTAQVPLSCCKFVDKTKFPADVANLQFVDAYQCLTNPTSTSANILIGCHDAIQSKIMTYSTIVIAVGIGIGVLEILGIIFACCLCCALGKDD